MFRLSSLETIFQAMKYTFVPLVILKIVLARGQGLLEYATVGCPVDCGVDLTEEHIMSAIKHGPHSSTMKAPALKALHIEVQEKIQCRFHLGNYEKICQKLKNITCGYDTS